MKSYVIGRLRELSTIKGKQKTWISDLSDDQLYEIFTRLRKQENARSIAQLCQNKWKINPEASIHSLNQGILKFKKRIAHLLLDPPPEKDRDQIFSDYYEDYPKITCRVEGLRKNKILVMQLRDRISRLIQEENETGINYPYLNRDIMALSTLEKTIQKQEELARKLGNKNLIDKTDYDVRMEVMRERAAALVKHSTPEALIEMQQAVKHLISIIEEAPVYADDDWDGMMRIGEKF